MDSGTLGHVIAEFMWHEQVAVHPPLSHTCFRVIMLTKKQCPHILLHLKSQGLLQLIGRLCEHFLKVSILWTTGFIIIQEHIAAENLCAYFCLFSLISTNFLGPISISCYVDGSKLKV